MAKYFVLEQDALSALRQIEDKYIAKEHVTYIGVRKFSFGQLNLRILFSEKFQFNRYFVEIGYSKYVDGKLHEILDLDSIEKSISIDKRLSKPIYNFATKKIKIRVPVKYVESQIFTSKTSNQNKSKTKSNTLFDTIQLQSGTSIGNKANCGTLGAIFQIKHKGYENEYFGISNWHVLKAGVDEKYPLVYRRQQSCGEHEKLTEQAICGKVCWSAVDKFREIAFIHFTKGEIKKRNSTLCGYKLSGSMASAQYNQDALKCGQTSDCNKVNNQCVPSKVYAKHVTAKVDGSHYAILKDNSNTLIFKNQIMTYRHTNGGDSGSALVNNNKDVIGIIFAITEDQNFSLANDINFIFHNSDNLRTIEEKYILINQNKIPVDSIKVFNLF